MHCAPLCLHMLVTFFATEDQTWVGVFATVYWVLLTDRILLYMQRGNTKPKKSFKSCFLLCLSNVTSSCELSGNLHSQL